jgi:hypothetical protein
MMIYDLSNWHSDMQSRSSAPNGSRGKDSDRERQHPRSLGYYSWMKIETWF